MMAENYPRTAYILSLIGGILEVAVGVPLAIIGIITILGVVCLIWPLIFGILIIVFALKLKSARDPNAVKSASIAIIILSILAGINIISLIGGILGLIWEPPIEMPQEIPAPPPPPPPL